MLAIPYTSRREFYNYFGCYRHDDTPGVKNKKQKGRNVLNDAFVLSIEQQNELHCTLRSSLVKEKDNVKYIVGTDIIAYLLMGKEIILNLLDKDIQRKMNDRAYGDMTFEVKPKKDDQSQQFNSIVRLRSLIRNATKGTVLKLIEFDHFVYQRNIPNYISILKEHFAREGHLHTIPIVANFALQTDLYFIKLFKERKVVRGIHDLNKIGLRADYVYDIQVSSIKDLASIHTKICDSGAETMDTMGSVLDFGHGQKLLCNMPINLTTHLIGMLYKEIFKFCMLTCSRESYEVMTFEVGAKVLSVRARSNFIKSVNVSIVADKIIKEIKALKMQERLNIVIIGNKGEGKSTATKQLASSLKLRFNYDVKVYSSDSYGRRLNYICLKYGIDHPKYLTEEQVIHELNLVSQETEAALDVEDSPSWYEKQAEIVLKNNGIILMNQLLFVINRNRVKLQQLKDDFKEIIIERLESKAIMSFSAYYEAIQGAEGTNRISIFECHTTEESKQVARTDITFRLEPITNGLGNLIERQRGTVENNMAEILLYLVYADLIGKTNPGVYLSDLLQMF